MGLARGDRRPHTRSEEPATGIRAALQQKRTEKNPPEWGPKGDLSGRSSTSKLVTCQTGCSPKGKITDKRMMLKDI